MFECQCMCLPMYVLGAAGGAATQACKGLADKRQTREGGRGTVLLLHFLGSRRSLLDLHSSTGWGIHQPESGSSSL